MHPFASWSDLLAHVNGGGKVAYHAPLDILPARVVVGRVFKNGKIRVVPLSRGASSFTADAAHLPRFRKVD